MKKVLKYGATFIGGVVVGILLGANINLDIAHILSNAVDVGIRKSSNEIYSSPIKTIDSGVNTFNKIGNMFGRN